MAARSDRPPSVDHPEGLGVAGIEVEGPGVAVDREGHGQQAPYAGGDGVEPEARPASVVSQVLGVEDAVLGHGIEAGPLPGAPLDGIEFDHQGVGGVRRADVGPLGHEDPGVVTPLDRGHGQRDQLVASVAATLPSENRASTVLEMIPLSSAAGS